MENLIQKETTEKLLRDLEAHPLTTKIRAEQAAEILKTRKAAAAEMKRIQADTGAITRLWEEIDGLTGEIRDLDQRKAGLQGRINDKRRDLMSMKQERDADMARAAELLYTTYDPEIDEGISFFRDQQEKLRHKRADTYQEGGELNIYTMKKGVKKFSNLAAINGALTYCRVAIEELEALKLEPSFNPEKIEVLKAGIPSIEVMSEFDSERPILPKLPGELDLLPDGEQTDYLTRKLLRKVRKLLEKKN